ncbi:solute carrier organic anion transporter family member 3A1-like [Copidosoma floridanum]|uniref:solute carrier organic anion transporter family member 3A1-like n=1 Tax=Copidosoma floridanum TaxID=29053 RepID=UPI0006C94F1F|nr:solute carrier organic anion transporter family member 3A1-like [Copidosoma floridanum]
MAGEDQLTLSNGGSGEPVTIIPANGKLTNGNGVHKDKPRKHNNNGSIPAKNGKCKEDQQHEIVALENGKGCADDKSSSFRTDELEDMDDITCGWGPFKPAWLQVFATKQMFLVIFCATWVLQGMYSTYFVSVITTIEKLFQIQSKTTGLIMSATEIGQIGSSLLLTYYGGQGHRPRWIAWGMVLFAVSSFTCSLPHFIFGDQLIKQNELLFNGGTLSGDVNGTNFSLPIPANLCKYADRNDNASINSWSVYAHHEQRTDTDAYCKGDFLADRQIQKKIVTIVLAIFFVSLLGVGMGQTTVYTLGIPYIDDNVAGRESPLYFAITIGVRILGPAMGFMLGSLCTMVYVDLSSNPPITPSDPRWMGAWWLGLVLISSLLILVSVGMFAFPTRLPKSRTPPKRIGDSKKPSLTDFPKSVKRLLKNDILMLRTASSVLHLLPIAGLYTFLPKYLESQFRLAAHNANFVSGIGGILVMGLGIIVSGFFIIKFKPNARFVAAWIAFTAVAYAIGMGILMFVGCTMNDFTGITTNGQGISKFDPVCDTTCECDQNKFSPICGVDGKTYFSACHAGCSNYTVSDGRVVNFTDCQCIGAGAANQSLRLPAAMPGTAKTGYCPLDCNNFYIYVGLFSLFVFIHSTSEVGSMLLILRCVDPRDKAMALGLIQFAIGLFGNVPCPVVYGAVVDSACLVWEWSCGERGACWLYDSNVFRMFFHGTTGSIMALAFLVDIIVFYRAGSINFVEDRDNEGGTAEEMANLKVVEKEYLLARPNGESCFAPGKHEDALGVVVVDEALLIDKHRQTTDAS